LRHSLDPAGGAYNSPPDSLAGLEECLLLQEGKWKEIRERKGRRVRQMEGTERERSEGEGGQGRSVPHHF